MSDKKYTIKRKYINKEGVEIIKNYNWKKYGDFHCEICNKTLSYSSKTKHVKSKGHIRLKNYIEELNKLKSQTQQTQQENN